MVFNESKPTGLHPELRGPIPHVAVENPIWGAPEPTAKSGSWVLISEPWPIALVSQELCLESSQEAPWI